MVLLARTPKCEASERIWWTSCSTTRRPEGTKGKQYQTCRHWGRKPLSNETAAQFRLQCLRKPPVDVTRGWGLPRMKSKAKRLSVALHGRGRAR